MLLTTNDTPQKKQSIRTRKARRNGITYYLLIAAGVIFCFILFFILAILSLRWVDPPFTAFTIQENWAELGVERYNLRDYWVDGEEIPDHLKWAVVASEDQHFWEHRGFDWEAIDEALEERSRGERQRGASTISQQVAKNLFLTPAQSFFRKGVEACITVVIELFWPKERILEVYLNIAEFGPGLFGIGKASMELFGSAPHELEPEESARMAAVLPSPKRMRVEPPSPYAQERSLWILRQMTQLTGVAYIPQEEMDETDIEEDFDPLPWDFETDFDSGFDTEFDFSIEIDSVNVQEKEDTLLWDEIPDSLLNFNEP